MIDTGSINTNQLRRRIVETFTDVERAGVAAGLARHLRLRLRHPPRRRPRLRLPVPAQPPLDRRAATADAGSTSRSLEYVLDHEPAQHFLADVVGHARAGRSRPSRRRASRTSSIAIGCTGGRHRSVAIAEEVRRRLAIEQRRLSPRHRAMRVVAVGGGHGTAVSLRALKRSHRRRHRRRLGRRRRGIDRSAARDAERGGGGGPAQVSRWRWPTPRTRSTASFEHRFTRRRAQRPRRREPAAGRASSTRPAISRSRCARSRR